MKSDKAVSQSGVGEGEASQRRLAVWTDPNLNPNPMEGMTRKALEPMKERENAERQTGKRRRRRSN